MLRILAYHCGSTALAFAMHTHQVAIPAWRWTHQKAVPVEPLLKRIAAERIILLSSGGSDWIGGSGKAEKVDGGYRINARKVFTSGAPTGDLLMTGAVLESAGKPPMVLHFGVPMNSPHVKVLDTWRTLGMRGTGSHDVLIDGHVVPEAAVGAEAQGRRVASAVPDHRHHRLPADLCRLSRRGRERARHGRRARQAQAAGTRHVIDLAGRMDTELAGARLALEHMLAAVRLNAPSADTINQVMIGTAAGGAPRHRRRRARDGGWPAAPASTAPPAWSADSATSRPPATTRCRPARRPSTPAPWRWACRWSGSSEDRA